MFLFPAVTRRGYRSASVLVVLSLPDLQSYLFDLQRVTDVSCAEQVPMGYGFTYLGKLANGSCPRADGGVGGRREYVMS